MVATEWDKQMDTVHLSTDQTLADDVNKKQQIFVTTGCSNNKTGKLNICGSVHHAFVLK